MRLEIARPWVRFPEGLRCAYSSDPAVRPFIFVGAEREENLIRNDPDKSEFTTLRGILSPPQRLCPRNLKSSTCLCLQWSKEKKKLRKKIHLFAGRAVKRERRKGSSRRQQPAYGAAVNEVARELLRSASSPKRENGGRRYIKHDGMIASPVGSCVCC